jgi:hypothetical protein
MPGPTKDQPRSLAEVAEHGGAAVVRARPGGPDTERLVRSVERVRDIGEVLTPAATVDAMLDLLPHEMWQVHPSPTFFETSCGDGNFLVAILERKLAKVSSLHEAEDLPGGTEPVAVRFHALEALASIYAVDISGENVVGGVPGNEMGARMRLVSVLKRVLEDVLGIALADRSATLQSARWIVHRNIQIGNMLATNPDGTPSGRERLPLVHYEWRPDSLQVMLSQTSLGAAMGFSASESSGVLSLLEVFNVPTVWTGAATELHTAPIAAPDSVRAPARNGNSVRPR